MEVTVAGTIINSNTQFIFRVSPQSSRGGLLQVSVVGSQVRAEGRGVRSATRVHSSIIRFGDSREKGGFIAFGRQTPHSAPRSVDVIAPPSSGRVFRARGINVIKYIANGGRLGGGPQGVNGNIPRKVVQSGVGTRA